MRADWRKKVINKLREDGGIGWWEEYKIFRRKYELGSEYGSVHSWKENIKNRNEDWEEEVSSTLKWYRRQRIVQGWRGI